VLDPGKLKSILVAEDQAVNLEVIKQFFGTLGVTNVTYCINGQLAIDACKRGLDEAVGQADAGSTVKPFSILILDLQMPYKNGI
jgi:CheY-like chemotaxis protein